MKNRILISLIAAFFAVCLVAQVPTATPLENGDLDKFIKTYKPLTADLEDLGEDFEKVDDYNMMQALAANQEVMSVFKKHGWDDQWLGKWVTISMSYGLIKMEEQMAQLPAEQRAQFEQYLSASVGQWKEMVSDEDVKKVKERIVDLDSIFEN